jgi:hypothetical protein
MTTRGELVFGSGGLFRVLTFYPVFRILKPFHVALATSALPSPINSATPRGDDTRVLSKGGQAPVLPNRQISAANICQARREVSKSITRNPGDRSHSTGEFEWGT